MTELVGTWNVRSITNESAIWNEPTSQWHQVSENWNVLTTIQSDARTFFHLRQEDKKALSYEDWIKSIISFSRTLV